MPPLVEYLATYWLTFSLIESCVSLLRSHLLWTFEYMLHLDQKWSAWTSLWYRHRYPQVASHQGAHLPWELSFMSLWELYIKLWAIICDSTQEGTSPNPCRPQHIAGGVVSCFSMACMCLHHPVSCRQYECGYRIIAKQGYPTLRRTLAFACLIVTCTILYGHWFIDLELFVILPDMMVRSSC